MESWVLRARSFGVVNCGYSCFILVASGTQTTCCSFCIIRMFGAVSLPLIIEEVSRRRNSSGGVGPCPSLLHCCGFMN